MVDFGSPCASILEVFQTSILEDLDIDFQDNMGALRLRGIPTRLLGIPQIQLGISQRLLSSPHIGLVR